MPKPPLIFWHPFGRGGSGAAGPGLGAVGCPGVGAMGWLGLCQGRTGCAQLCCGKSGSLPQLEWEADEMFKGLL